MVYQIRKTLFQSIYTIHYGVITFQWHIQPTAYNHTEQPDDKQFMFTNY